jgi:hypothetical protein
MAESGDRHCIGGSFPVVKHLHEATTVVAAGVVFPDRELTSEAAKETLILVDGVLRGYAKKIITAECERLLTKRQGRSALTACFGPKKRVVDGINRPRQRETHEDPTCCCDRFKTVCTQSLRTEQQPPQLPFFLREVVCALAQTFPHRKRSRVGKEVSGCSGIRRHNVPGNHSLLSKTSHDFQPRFVGKTLKQASGLWLLTEQREQASAEGISNRKEIDWTFGSNPKLPPTLREHKCLGRWRGVGSLKRYFPCSVVIPSLGNQRFPIAYVDSNRCLRAPITFAPEGRKFEYCLGPSSLRAGVACTGTSSHLDCRRSRDRTPVVAHCIRVFIPLPIAQSGREGLQSREEVLWYLWWGSRGSEPLEQRFKLLANPPLPFKFGKCARTEAELEATIHNTQMAGQLRERRPHRLPSFVDPVASDRVAPSLYKLDCTLLRAEQARRKDGLRDPSPLDFQSRVASKVERSGMIPYLCGGDCNPNGPETEIGTLQASGSLSREETATRSVPFLQPELNRVTDAATEPTPPVCTGVVGLDTKPGWPRSDHSLLGTPGFGAGDHDAQKHAWVTREFPPR